MVTQIENKFKNFVPFLLPRSCQLIDILLDEQPQIHLYQFVREYCNPEQRENKNKNKHFYMISIFGPLVYIAHKNTSILFGNDKTLSYIANFWFIKNTENKSTYQIHIEHGQQQQQK